MRAGAKRRLLKKCKLVQSVKGNVSTEAETVFSTKISFHLCQTPHPRSCRSLPFYCYLPISSSELSTFTLHLHSAKMKAIVFLLLAFFPVFSSSKPRSHSDNCSSIYIVVLDRCKFCSQIVWEATIKSQAGWIHHSFSTCREKFKIPTRDRLKVPMPKKICTGRRQDQTLQKWTMVSLRKEIEVCSHWMWKVSLNQRLLWFSWIYTSGTTFPIWLKCELQV